MRGKRKKEQNIGILSYGCKLAFIYKSSLAIYVYVCPQPEHGQVHDTTGFKQKVLNKGPPPQPWDGFVL